ncbi:MAG: WYL domain-containing protein [Bacteroidaceae bacterium]|nr:WYL domain-containing protein [Bacteroidaceae bacterium]
MADYKKCERQIQILIQFLTKPKQSFSVSQMMHAMGLSEAERRNVQRDMNDLVNQPNNLVISEGSGAHKTYKTGLNVMDKLELPNFEEVLLQFVFLQRIMNIYPGTADLIKDLLERIQKNLPYKQRDRLEEVYRDISSRVLFMGMQPDIDETANEKLNTILKAIRTHHEIHTHYENTYGEEIISDRVPLMMVLYQNEIYIGCVSHGDPLHVYAIKLRRIISVDIIQKTFVENNASLEALRKKVRDLSLFDREPGTEKIELTFPLLSRKYVEERPYHRSMVIKERKGMLHVTMEVNVNSQLVQWILFHTENGVNVVKPDSLKKRLLEIGQTLVGKYGDN